jgi:hypothetical protein
VLQERRAAGRRQALLHARRSRAAGAPRAGAVPASRRLHPSAGPPDRARQHAQRAQQRHKQRRQLLAAALPGSQAALQLLGQCRRRAAGCRRVAARICGGAESAAVRRQAPRSPTSPGRGAQAGRRTCSAGLAAPEALPEPAEQRMRPCHVVVLGVALQQALVQQGQQLRLRGGGGSGGVGSSRQLEGRLAC